MMAMFSRIADIKLSEKTASPAHSYKLSATLFLGKAYHIN